MNMSNYKISGTGWVCVQNKEGGWIPSTKLSETQLAELKAVEVYVETKTPECNDRPAYVF